jgi:hypothetical protein
LQVTSVKEKQNCFEHGRPRLIRRAEEGAVGGSSSSPTKRCGETGGREDKKGSNEEAWWGRALAFLGKSSVASAR